MNKILVFIIPLILINNVMAVSSIKRVDINIETTILGNHAVGDDVPYRVKIAQNKVLPALYPEKLNANLDLNVDYIEGNYSVRIVIIAEFEIREYEGNTEGVNSKYFVLLNESIEKGSDFFDLEEIDHSFAAYDNNGNYIMPILSYDYFEKYNLNSTIEGAIEIYFECECKEWNMEIKYSGRLLYNGDDSFADSLKYRATITPETLELKAAFEFSPLFIICLICFKNIFSLLKMKKAI